MKTEIIYSLVRSEINAIDEIIKKKISSEVALINQINYHIVRNQGKRLRSLMVILAAQSLGYNSKKYLIVGGIVELIHTATLLHDDVIDEGKIRRGKRSANNVFGNTASILTGDFLYSRAFQMMLELENAKIMKIFANATNKIAEGEMLQLTQKNNFYTKPKDYMGIIYNKTSKLFEAGCDVICKLTNASCKERDGLISYAMNFGSAFQIINDIKDCIDDSQEGSNKNNFQDLAAGNITLPIIHAFKNANTKEKALLKKNADGTKIVQKTEIMEIIHRTNAIDYALNEAQSCIENAIYAIGKIRNSKYKDALIALAQNVKTQSSLKNL